MCVGHVPNNFIISDVVVLASIEEHAKTGEGFSTVPIEPEPWKYSQVEKFVIF